MIEGGNSLLIKLNREVNRLEKMKLKEFMQKYCGDIIESSKARKNVIPEMDFTYDDYMFDEDGEPLKAIDVYGTLIPIRDILSLSERDFIGLYPDENALDAYRLYLENFIIVEGEEVLEMVRRQFSKSMSDIEKYSSIKLEDMV